MAGMAAADAGDLLNEARKGNMRPVVVVEGDYRGVAVENGEDGDQWRETATTMELTSRWPMTAVVPVVHNCQAGTQFGANP